MAAIVSKAQVVNQLPRILDGSGTQHQGHTNTCSPAILQALSPPCLHSALVIAAHCCQTVDSSGTFHTCGHKQAIELSSTIYF